LVEAVKPALAPHEAALAQGHATLASPSSEGLSDETR
jgi:hypothetical protein